MLLEQLSAYVFQAHQTNGNKLVEFDISNTVITNQLMQETIFLDFKHSTTCYKKSNQSCFKIQRNSAKSPVFLAQFILLGPSGYYTAPLEVLIKVVRNVTREFEKLTNTSPSRKRRSPALSEDESTSQPKGK